MDSREAFESYYERKTKQAKKSFEHHIATFDVLSHQVSVLEWKQPGTRNYMVRYLMDGNILSVSGDLGTAVFELTWVATPDSFSDLSMYYFNEKLSAYHNGRYIIDEDYLKAELAERFEDLTSETNSDSEADLIEVIDSLGRFSSINELAEYVHLPDITEILEKYDENCWEWIYDIGQVIAPRIVYYLVGLQMAAEQLRNQTQVK